MQRPLDSTYADARAAGCDTVQFKHDGMAAQFAVANGRLFTTDFSAHDLADPVTGIDPTINCTLLGTYMPYTNKRHVFDCVLVQEGETVVDLRTEAYRSRYVAAKIQVKMLGDVVTLVQNLPILRAPALWATLPFCEGVKGLVFRNSKEDAHGPVRVARWYREAPRELV